MFNYFILLVLFTTVVTRHNIILLNEETLILVCFVTFFWLCLKNLSVTIEENLQAKIFSIRKNLVKSLKSTIFHLHNLLSTQSRFWDLLQNFKGLGNSCLKLSYLVTDMIVINSTQSTLELFPQKLQFTLRLENQTARLLSKLVVLKLKKAINLKNFYLTTMHNSHFICFNKIVVRECIQKIYSI